MIELKTSDEQIKEFTKRLLRNEKEYIEALQQLIPTENDPAFEQKRLLLSKIIDKWIELNNLAGIQRGTKKILSPIDLQNITNAVMNSPFKLEDSLKLLQQRLKISFPPELQRMIIEEVQSKKEMQSMLDKLKSFNVPAIAMGLVLKRLPKPSLAHKVISNSLLTGAGTVSAIDLYRKTMTLSDYTIDVFQDLDTYLDLFGLSMGIVGLFSKFRNPLFSIKTLQERIDFSVPFTQNVIKAKKNLGKKISELQSTLEKKQIQELMPIIAFADSLSPDISKILQHTINNTDELRIVRGILEEGDTLDRLIKGEKIPELSRLISHKYIEKLFSVYDIKNIKVISEGNLIRETTDYAETISAVDELLRNNKNVILEISTDRFSFTRNFIPDYIPTFTRSAIVKFTDKSGEIRSAFVDEIELPEFIARLNSEGMSLQGIIRPSLQKGQTSKFVKEVLEKIKDKVIEYKDINTFLENVDDDLRNILREAKEEVFTYAKTTEKGFIEKALKLKGEEFAKEFLKINILQRISNPIPILHLKSQLEAIKDLSPQLARLKRVVDYLSNPNEMKTIKEANSIFKRLWLFANLPVSILNSTLNPIFITALNLSAKNQTEQIIPFTSKFLKHLFSESTIKETAHFLQREPSTSLVDLVSSIIKFPFSSIVNAYKRALLEEGGKFSELVFGTKNVDDEILRTFLFSEGVLAHPTFFTAYRGRVGNWIDTLSAFFTANYIPFFYSLKAVWDAYFTSMGLRGLKKISPFMSLAGTTAMIGTLVGFRQTSLMGIFENALQVGDVIASFLTPEDETQSPLWEFFISEIGEKTNRVGEKFSNALTFALDTHSFSFIPSLFTQIALGRGLIGWLTNWRTEAASQVLPSIADSPIIQLLTSYNRFYTEIKLREHEIKDPTVSTIALTKAILQNVGIFNKLADSVNGKVNSVIYLPPSDFTQALKNIMLPSSLIEKPAFVSLYDKRTIEKTINEGIIGLQYIFGSLQKMKERKGVSLLIQNIDKNLERISKKAGTDEEIDPRHAIYLLLLRHHLKSNKPVDVEKTAQKLEKVLKIPASQLAPAISEMQNKIIIAKQLTKYE